MSLAELLVGSRPDISGTTPATLDDYVTEVLAGGFPGMRGLRDRQLRAALDGYLERVIDRDFAEQGMTLRRPDTVKLSATVDADDTKHLKWLKDRIGDQLLDAVLVTTGSEAYRREDGIAVVPAALLGP